MSVAAPQYGENRQERNRCACTTAHAELAASVLMAHLFDIGKAAPKKPPTPAQRAAAANAVREHQARAAERHGIARDALTHTDNPVCRP
ncbi:hypothetical protein [Nocardia nova]|uniref:hypothetical protein n=1 Tax=Nocardia nova TaxID=37330 RepID=UPI0011B00255|nr:hypothetical protein [Nocardia nova]